MPFAARVLVAVIALPLVALGLAWAVGGQAVTFAGVPATVPVVLLAFAVNWAAFLPAAALRTERFYDAVGSATYLLVVLASLGLVALADAPLSVPAAVTGCWSRVGPCDWACSWWPGSVGRAVTVGSTGSRPTRCGS